MKLSSIKIFIQPSVDSVLGILAMKLFCKTIMLLLIFSVCLISRVGVSAPIHTTEATSITFLPQPLTTELGQTFQAECWINNVHSLYGLEIQITWDPAVIRYVSHVKTIPVNTYPSGVLWSPTISVKNVVDETANIPDATPGTRYWLAEASMVPAPVFSGSGMAFIMTFQAVATGDTWINFTSSTLVEDHGGPIYHSAQNTLVSVYSPAPEISSIKHNGTSPYPYVHSEFIRPNEPVTVTANVTDFNGVGASTLCYRANGGSWWNTTMHYNSSTSLWTATIPGQQGNSTVEFFIIASDTFGATSQSSTYSYDVQPLLLGDLNGDGVVGILDVVLCTGNYGKRYP